MERQDDGKGDNEQQLQNPPSNGTLSFALGRGRWKQMLPRDEWCGLRGFRAFHNPR